jgi:6-methylpretetramide 4-monooxygenase
MVAQQRVDVAIVGAGFAGLALACRLAELGFAIVVLERRSELPRAGAAITLQPNGLAALECLGVLEAVEAGGSRMRRVSVRDPSDRELGEWDYGELRHPHPTLIGIRRISLLTLLAARLDALGANAPRFGWTFEALVRERGAVAGLRCRGPAGQELELRARCVAGADGAGSAVRSALGARTLSGRPDPYVVGVGRRPPQLADADALMYLGAGYANGVMQLGDRAYFWDHADPAVRGPVLARDLDAWRRLYAERVPGGAEITADLTSFDELTVLTGRVTAVAPYAQDGAVLIGDAAGTVHPHAGQGANLAFEDAVALGDALATAGSGAGPIGKDTLARQLRRRRRRRLAGIARSAVAARTLDAPNPAWRLARGATFAAGRIGIVRRALLREQAGVGLTW